MDIIFFNRISNSNAGTLSRYGNLELLMRNLELLPDLIAFATDLTNKNQYKGVWLIEMVAETDADLLAPYIDLIANVAGKYKHESSIRGISRTILFLAKSKKVSLTEAQQEKLIEISLDRLIGDDKVAPKSSAMYTLLHFSIKHNWLKEELRNIINKDFANQSAGYKAAAREVLRKI